MSEVLYLVMEETDSNHSNTNYEENKKSIGDNLLSVPRVIDIALVLPHGRSRVQVHPHQGQRISLSRSKQDNLKSDKFR